MLSSRAAAAATVSLVLLAGQARAQWLGPFSPMQRIEYTSGNVFVGNSGVWNPVVRSDVVDLADTGNIITFHAYAGTPQNGVRTTAVWGETNNPQGRALQGFNFATSGTGAGVWAETASTAGYGLRARATATTGACTAGFYDNASTQGTAVYGEVTNNTASAAPVAIWGRSVNNTGYAGFFEGGRSYFEKNVGFGTSTPNNPVQVVGTDAQACLLVSNGTTAAGNNTGGPAAITGILTPTGPGIFAAGVWGVSNGTSSGGIGVAGYQNGSGFGIYGNAGASGYGGVFDRKVFVNGDLQVASNGTVLGNLNVVNNLTKGGGSFKIDHPLDPANKYLYHSFVESPDMMNIYNGNVVTDADGYAMVTMPEWFTALNMDFRYQVSVIDENAPDMHFVRVARKLSGNTFVIKSVPGNLEVSWQITGIRHDAYAEKNRIQVEVVKTGAEKGHYLHPSAFGQPESMGMGPLLTPPQLSEIREAARRQLPAQPQSASPVRPTGSNEPPLTPAQRNTH